MYYLAFTCVVGVDSYTPRQRSHLTCLKSIGFLFLGMCQINTMANLSKLSANLLDCNCERFYFYSFLLLTTLQFYNPKKNCILFSTFYLTFHTSKVSTR